MWLIIIILISIAAYYLHNAIFYWTHNQPLTEDEVQALAEKRRQRNIDGYYSFIRGEVDVDKTFKSKMNPSGQIYNINEPLYRVPAFVASLLKGKKHEWVVFVFEADRKAKLMWCNKGDNSESVTPRISRDKIIQLARANNCVTILRFHNHPNSDPSHFNCTMASEQDKKSANYFTDETIKSGLNWIDFVCERGYAYQFFRSVLPSFEPVEKYIEAVNAENGVSKKQNYLLHLENGASGGSGCICAIVLFFCMLMAILLMKGCGE